METKLVTPELGGKFIFTDTFPFFKRVARLDDTVDAGQEKLENIESRRTNDEDHTENVDDTVAKIDKNSRRIL